MSKTYNPFPGLRSFRIDEKYLFFGRENHTAELLRRLRETRFLAVVGTSGSGKSSLVKAGVLPELHKGTMTKAGSSWEVAVMRPGGSPMTNLALALLEADLYDPEQPDVVEQVRATLSRSRQGLSEAARQSDLPDGTNLLVVVDQFEELFRFRRSGAAEDHAEAIRFVQLLLAASHDPTTPIYIVLTMRSDYIGDCTTFPGLAEAVNAAEFLIPRMDREQRRAAIEGPVKVAGAAMAPRLLQKLLNDLGDDPDQLPILQHALMRTWDVWAEAGDSAPLDLDDYQRVGRMDEALSLHADEVYHTLASDQEREWCRGIFEALTVKESENRGIRRPQRLATLGEILEVPIERLAPVIDAFRRQGVTFLMPPADVELTGDTVIDISHESLMRVWGRLRQWVEDEAQAASVYRRLAENATLHARGEAGLFRDPELGLTLSWLERARHANAAWAERYQSGFAEAMAFLEQSKHAAEAEEQEKEAARQRELAQAKQLAAAERLRAEDQKRAAGRLRWLVAGSLALAVAAFIAFFMAQKSERKAQASKLEAEQARARAEDSQAAADTAKQKALAAETSSRRTLYVTDLQLAGRLIDDERSTTKQIADRLIHHDPASNPELDPTDDLRSFEWYYLNRKAAGADQSRVLAGIDQVVVDCVSTADGKVTTLDREGKLQRWDPTSGVELGAAVDLKRGRELGTMALSPDGRSVALAIGDQVHLVDTRSGEPLRAPLAARARTGMVFTSGSETLVTVDDKIACWDTQGGALFAEGDSKIAIDGPKPVSISSDGLTLMVGCTRTGQITSNAFSVFRLPAKPSQPSAAAVAAPLVLVLPDSEWKYLHPTDGVDPATADPDFHTTFFAANFDDSAWKSGKDSPSKTGGFGYGDDWFEGVDIGEPQTKELGKSAYFRHRFTTDQPHDWLELECYRDDGVIIYLDGVEVGRDNMKAGKEAYHLAAQESVGQNTDNRLKELTPSRIPLKGKLAAGEHVLAISLHNPTQPSSDLRLGAVTLHAEQPLRKVEILHSNRNANLGSTAAMVLSPDGQSILGSQLFSSSVQRNLVSSGNPVEGDSEQHVSPVSAIAFNPEGKQMATASIDGTIKVWDDYEKLGGAKTQRLRGAEGKVRQLVFVDGGRRLVSIGEDKSARVWDLDSGRGGVVPSGWGPRFSPDGRFYAASDSGEYLSIRDTMTGKIVRQLDRGDSARRLVAVSVAFSPDNRLLAAGFGGADGGVAFSFIELWDIDRGERLAILPGATAIPDFPTNNDSNQVAALAFSPDGRHLVAGFGPVNTMSSGDVGNFPLLVYEVSSRRLVQRLRGHGNFCFAVTFSRDGSRLASASHDGTARIWDTTSWEQLHVLKNPDTATESGGGRVADVAFSPDGDLLAMASHEHQVHLWDAVTGDYLGPLEGHSNAVQSVVFSPDGRTLASGGRDSVVRLWNVVDRREIMALEAGFNIDCLSFSPGGRQLLAGGYGAVRFWPAWPVEEKPGDRLASQLGALLASEAGFASRIRMLWEEPQLAEALEKLLLQEPDSAPVQAALAAARAHRHAVREEWPQVVEAFGLLKMLSPEPPISWLGTPGLLRVSRALLEEDQAVAAATLLAGLDEQELRKDGAEMLAVFGFTYELVDGTTRVTSVIPGSSAARRGLQTDDVLLKIGDAALSGETTLDELSKLLGGGLGTEVQVTLRRGAVEAEAEAEEVKEITLVKTSAFTDPEIAAWDTGLAEALEGRLGAEPGDPGLLELRAELARLHSDQEARLADYTAAIELMEAQDPQPLIDLQRLHRRRGDTHVGAGNWAQAIADYAAGITEQTEEPSHFLFRARAYEGVKDWAAAAADWNRAVAPDVAGATSLSEFAGRLDSVGQADLADAGRARARGILETLLEADPGDPGAIERLTEVLLAGVEATRWTVLEPSEMTSAGGATLEELDDHSILASGVNPEQDTYTVVAPTDLEKITGFRLEALPHELLPKGGPGRNGPNGNFHLNELRVTAAEKAVPLTGIAVEYDPNGQVDRVIDGVVNQANGWDNGPKPGQANTAIIAAAPFSAGDHLLKIELHHMLGAPGHNLGRFRLSVTSEPDPVGTFKFWQQLEDPATRLAAAYALAGRSDEAVAWYGRLWKAIQFDDERTALVDVLKKDADSLTALAKLHPQDRHLQLAQIENLAQRGKAALERKDASQAIALLQEARALADTLLADHPEVKWTVLEPSEMSSAGGATLELLDDHSILASGVNPDCDTYTVVARCALEKITGFRLEALTHGDLPQGGPGRNGANGNFHLNELRVSVGDEAIPLTEIAAERDPSGQVDKVIDGVVDRAHGWNNGFGAAAANTAIIAAAPFSAEGDALKFELHHTPGILRHNLGRFRLSITSDPEPAQDFQLRQRLAAQTAELDGAFAAAYASDGQTEQAAAVARRFIEQAGSASIISEFLKTLETLGLPELTSEARAQARLRIEAMVVADTGAPAALGLLAELVLDSTGPQWTVLEPTEMNSEGGATLTLQPDQSILASGENPKDDTYTVVAPSDLEKITAIRLEALPHEQLPEGGPGRYRKGGFELKEFSVSAGDQPALLTGIVVDYSQGKLPTEIIDGIPGISPNSYWGISPHVGEKHVAIISTEAVSPGGADLKFQLSFGEALGCFRLSVCADPVDLDREERRFAAQKITDPATRLAAAYALAGQPDESVTWFDRAWKAAKTADARSALMETLTNDERSLAAIYKLHPENPYLQLARTQSVAQRGKAALERKDAAGSIALLQEARALADELLANYPEPSWTVLEPPEMTSEGGATLTVLDDHSILASGVNPEQDTYTVVAPTDLGKITGFRLEALPHELLPKGGPGRNGANGNFHLNELRVSVGDEAIPLTEIAAERDPSGQVDKVIDGVVDRAHGWNNGFGAAAANTAIIAAAPFSAEGDALKFELHHSGVPEHNLGRFRLSVTGAAEPLLATRLRQQLDAAQLGELDAALLTAYARGGQVAEAAALAGSILQTATTASRLREFLGSLEENGQPELLAAARSLARAPLEAMLAADPGDALALALLAELVLDSTVPQWTVLEPTEMNSEGGATLELLDDHSILASGENPERDTYTVVAPTDLKLITGFRLEALTHDSLPKGGPGRHPNNGCFHLNELRLSAGEQPVALTDIAVDQDGKGEAAQVIDGLLDKSRWSLNPNKLKDSTATILAAPFDPGETALKFEIYTAQQGGWGQYNLGRFRLSVSDDPQAFDLEERRFAAQKITDPATRLAAAYALAGQPDQSVTWFDRAWLAAKTADARSALMEVLTNDERSLAAIYKLHPENPHLQLARLKSLARRGEAALERKDAAQSIALLQEARTLADTLLAKYPEPDWTVLEPNESECRSEGRARLTVLDDQSILASGVNPDRDTYTVVAATSLERITGFRLEALTHDSLPKGGPGRHPINGCFHLNELRLEARGQAVALIDIAGDQDETGEAAKIIDGILDGAHRWSLDGNKLRDTTAVISTAPFEAGEAALQFQIFTSQLGGWGQYNLGRFRLAVTSDPEPALAFQLRQQFGATQLGELDLALAAAYALTGQPENAEKAEALVQRTLAAADNPEARRRLLVELSEAGWMGAVAEGLAREQAARPRNADLRRALEAMCQARGESLLEGGEREQAGLCFEIAAAFSDGGARAATLQQHLVDLGWLDAPEELVAKGSKWSYLDDGSDQGTGWRAAQFADGDWKSGPAPLGYGDDPATEISYGGDEDKRHLTTYFRTAFELAQVPGAQALVVSLQRDDGAVVYLNGVEIVRDSLPEGTIAFDTLANKTAGQENGSEARFYRFPVSSSALRSGKNVLAAEVHQADAGSSDLRFDLELHTAAGVSKTYPSAAALEALAEALEIPVGLRTALWIKTATRFYGGGEETRGDACLAMLGDERAVNRARVTILIGLGRHAEALALIELIEKSIGGRPAATPDQLRESRQLLQQKEDCLRALKQDDAADAVRQARLYPPRPVGTERNQIDLGKHYNASLYDSTGWSSTTDNNLARLPETFDPLKGVRFDLRGIVQLQRVLQLKAGDGLSRSEAPDIVGRGILLEGKVESGKLDGVLFAHGGPGNGYALILEDGVLQFLSRSGSTLTRVAAKQRLKGSGFTFRAAMSAAGDVVLAVDGEEIGSGKVSPVKAQPTDGLEVGRDGNVFVGDYAADFAFDGVISLTLTVLAAEESDRRSAQATGIKIGQKAPAIHFLTSCQYGREERGVEVASFVMHYADGTSETMQVKFLDDVADWIPQNGQAIPDVQVGWRGSNDANRNIVLSELVWKNPHPEKEIASIDFSSAQANAAPFLLGITLE